MLATALLGVVVSMFLSGLQSLQTATVRQTARGEKNDEVRLALAQLDREIRSGNVFRDPALENDPANGILPNMALRIYTQTDAPNRNPGNQCAQWRIDDGTLQTRRWDNADPAGSVTPWWTIANSIANLTATPQVAAFTLDGTSEYGGRAMKIRLVVDRGDDAGEAVQMDLTITGRNTQFNYPSTVCGTIPPY